MAEAIQCAFHTVNRQIFAVADFGDGESRKDTVKDFPFHRAGEKKNVKTRNLPENYEDWSNRVYARLKGDSDRLYQHTESADNLAHQDDLWMGTTLWKIFPQSFLKSFEKRLSKPGIVEIDLGLEDSEFADYPWEACARANWNQLGIEKSQDCHIVVVRKPYFPNLTWPQLNSMVRILVAGANPKGETAPNYEEELREIKLGLETDNKLKEFRDFELYKQNSITLLGLRDLIKDIRPDIVHLVSHGGKGYVQLQNEFGFGSPQYGQDILDILKMDEGLDNRVALFITTACLAMRGEHSKATKGLGSSVAREVPVSLGMQLPIREIKAGIFTRTFYSALARSLSTKEAYIHAREMLFRIEPDSPAWIAPVIFQGTYHSLDNSAVFQFEKIPDRIRGFINDWSILVEALRKEDQNRKIWDNCRDMVNETEAFMTSNYHRANKSGDYRFTSSADDIKKLITNIRENVTSGRDLLKGGKLEHRMSFQFGKIYAQLLESLQQLIDLLIELLETRT